MRHSIATVSLSETRTLHEKLSAIARGGSSRCWRSVCALMARPGLMLLVDQNAIRALRLADRGYVLETGRLILTESRRTRCSALQK